MYRCAPEQLRKLSAEQEAMVRLLPVDMVRVRDVVSARGAGTYLDLSMLPHPPDADEPDAEQEGGQPELSEAAGIGDVVLEEPRNEGGTEPERMEATPESEPVPRERVQREVDHD